MPKVRASSSFVRNVTRLMVGISIAQLIPAIIAPILTRLYTPHDMGVFGLYFVLSATLGSVINACYETALVLPEKQEDAINLAALGILIAAVFSIVCLIFIIILNHPITSLLKNNAISTWLYLVPLSAFLTGLFNVFSYLNTRMEHYKTIAQATVYKAVALACVQIIVGLIKAGPGSLIAGDLISWVVGNARIIKKTFTLQMLKNISWVEMKKQGLKYINFPKFSMLAILANQLSRSLIVILVGIFYSTTVLGYFVVVRYALGIPLRLISQAVQQVFLKEAAVEKQETGRASVTFDSTIKKLAVLSVLVGIFCYFFIEDIFAFVFGEQWRMAGVYARAFLPLICVQFVVSPVTILNNIFSKQRITLIWQLVLLALSVSMFLILAYMKLPFQTVLFYYSLVLALHYLLLYFILRRISKKGRL